MPNKKEKILLLDFCGTCVPFQSAPRYVDYTLAHYPKRTAQIRRFIRNGLVKLRIPHILERISKGHITEKEIELWPIKGYPEGVLNQLAQTFYTEEIVPNLIPEVMERLQHYKEDGYRLVLVSAGYGIYLKYFAKDHNIASDDIITSNIQIHNGYATGMLEGEDCIGQIKVIRIENRFNKEQIYSEAISDGYSDIPLLKWANRGMVVSSGQSWGTSFGFDTLFYKK